MPNETGNKPVVHTRKHIARLERERRQTRLILYTFIGILVAILGLVGYGYLDINYFQLRRPVATVGGREILASQFEARVRLQRQQLLFQYNQYMQYSQLFGLDVSQQIQQIDARLNTPVDLGDTVLSQMIDEELIRLESEKRGITVSEAEMNESMQDTFGYYPNGTPTLTITPTEVVFPTVPAEAFKIVTVTPIATMTPAATATPVAPTATAGTTGSTSTVEPTPSPTATLLPTATPTTGPTATALPTSTPYTFEGFQSEFDDTLEQYIKLGFTEADYRGLFENNLLRKKLFDVITADVPHAEEQVWARHILVPDEASALAVVERLKNGEDFGAIAAEVSQDPGSASAGGDLGWFGKGAMIPEFETVAFSLEPGQISDPVESTFGFHIIQVIARQERPLSPDAYEQARSKRFDEWLGQAYTDYGVELFDFWRQRVPTEPNLGTMATESANAASTAQAAANATVIVVP
jgi:parvulin-like peptidyl-prolyl isomerase